MRRQPGFVSAILAIVFLGRKSSFFFPGRMAPTTVSLCRFDLFSVSVSGFTQRRRFQKARYPEETNTRNPPFLFCVFLSSSHDRTPLVRFFVSQTGFFFSRFFFVGTRSLIPPTPNSWTLAIILIAARLTREKGKEKRKKKPKRDEKEVRIDVHTTL